MNVDWKANNLRTQLSIDEGIRRGYSITPVLLKSNIFLVGTEDDKGFMFKGIPGWFSFKTKILWETDEDGLQRRISKDTQKEFMEPAGMPFPKSYGVFSSVTELQQADFDYPVVAKQTRGSFSDNVYVGIQSMEELLPHAKKIFAENKVVLVEQQIEGKDYRIICVGDKYIGAVHRRQASVVGNGKDSIQVLVDTRNQEPERGAVDDTHVTNHYIVLDEVTDELLAEKAYTLETVPPEGERVYLQRKINAAIGTDYVDVTDELHESYLEPCFKLIEQFGLPMIGFDLITPDHTKPMNEVGGMFNEYNMGAYFDLVENCNVGEQHNVSGAIWDYIEANKDKIITRHFLPY